MQVRTVFVTASSHQNCQLVHGEKAWERCYYLWCYVHALGLDSVHAMNPAGQQWQVLQLDVYFCYQVYLCYKTGTMVRILGRDWIFNFTSIQK